jgi:hypothetical protein
MNNERQEPQEKRSTRIRMQNPRRRTNTDASTNVRPIGEITSTSEQRNGDSIPTTNTEYNEQSSKRRGTDTINPSNGELNPLEDPFLSTQENSRLKENTNKRKIDEVDEDEPEKEKVRNKIGRLIARYPGVKVRSSLQIMERLFDCSLSELKNIHTNIITDLASIRGTPTAELCITMITYHIDREFAKGYTNRCLNDVELKRDIEEEMINVIGELGTKIVIVFRLLNNLYRTIFKRDDDQLYYNQVNRDPLFSRQVEEEEDSEEFGVDENIETIRPYPKGVEIIDK